MAGLGLAAPLQLMVNWYERAVNFAFSPITPFVERIAESLGRDFPAWVSLDPAWQHSILLGGIMAGAIARGSVSIEGRVLSASVFLCGFGQAVLGPRGQIAMWLVWAAVLVVLALAVPSSWRGARPTSRELVSQLGQIASILLAVIVFVALNAGLGAAGL